MTTSRKLALAFAALLCLWSYALLIATSWLRKLGNEISNWENRDFQVALAGAHKQMNSMLVVLWLMLGAGVLIGLITAGSVGGWIVRAKRRLRAERERFQALANGAPVMIRLSGSDGLGNWFNQPWLDFTGRSLEEEVGEGWCQGVHPDDFDRCLQTFRTALAARRPFTMEYRLRRRDGSYRWVIDSGSPQYGPKAEFEGYAGSCIDIHERKQAEEVIRQSEERFRFLAESMPQMIFTARPDGTVDFVNAQWYTFSSLAFDALRGDGWLRLIHAEDAEETQRRWQNALAGGEPFQTEHRLRRADGVYRWHMSRAHPQRDADGRILLWIGSVTDIDHQKRAMHALEDADRRKDEFLAVLSHELRNPLAPTRNALHILRPMASLEPELADAYDVLERQIQQLTDIVDDLLDIFRISHGKIKLRLETLDLNLAVRLACEDHRSAIESSLCLTLELPDEPVWVSADRTRLTQVMSNLLNNAVKYTNPGGMIGVRVAVDRQRRQAVVAVRDTGIGISADLLETVFDTFSQAQRSLDRSRGGLGLGLSLVKGLVLLHGGSVQAHSPGLGHGTEITFSLPLVPAPVFNTHHLPALPAVNRSLRILIVEDNKDTARTLRVLLLRAGHFVTVAHTGPQGVHAARESQPEVVLCDLGLPELDGYEVARTLRQDGATSSIRLIAISGYGQEEDRQRSEEAGFDLHLTKPIDPAELTRLLAVLKIGP